MPGLILAALIATAFAQTSGPDALVKPFEVTRRGEAIATVYASCPKCAWGEAGREGVLLRLSVDGAYSQHIMLVRGAENADYPVTLGPMSPGRHAITVERDPSLSARGAGAPIIDRVDVKIVAADGGDESIAQSRAPILHARPNTVGKFTDVPVLAWYEIVPTARGRQFRYSIIFTNEDGGTATDRLMATWGRTTDIEFVYGVELDRSGRVLAEEFQGPGHEVPAFRGRHEAAHPVLFVSTDNNMVSESGPSTPRFAPAPERFDLANVSREVVMDRHPWSYAVTALEMLREGKIDPDAAAGSGRIPDLRRFAFVEACTELQNSAAVSFSVRASDGGEPRWFDSDRGLTDFRIVRTGCFRGAVPLPSQAWRPDAVRFRASSRPPPKDGVTPTGPPAVALTRVNLLFVLGEDYLPRPSTTSWTGRVSLPIDGDWREPK